MPFAKDDAYFFAGFQPNGVCYAPLTLGRPKTAHPTLIVMVEPNTPSDWYNRACYCVKDYYIEDHGG